MVSDNRLADIISKCESVLGRVCCGVHSIKVIYAIKHSTSGISTLR